MTYSSPPISNYSSSLTVFYLMTQPIELRTLHTQMQLNNAPSKTCFPAREPIHSMPFTDCVSTDVPDHHETIQVILGNKNLQG